MAPPGVKPEHGMSSAPMRAGVGSLDGLTCSLAQPADTVSRQRTGGLDAMRASSTIDGGLGLR
jgi:hypothetical protein